MTQAFIKLDNAAALAEVQKLVDLSPIKKEVGDVFTIDWSSAFRPSNILNTSRQVWEVVHAVVAAIEVLKTKWQEEHGAPLLGEDAANLAIDVLDTWIAWQGWTGKLLEAVDSRILRLLVEFVLHGKRGIVWLSAAKAVFGVA